VRSLRWLATLGLATCLSAFAADVDSLVRVLRDPDRDADAKGEACLQLMDLGPAAAPAVTALVGLLKSPEDVLRDYAVTTLDRIGPAARNALPALRRTAAQDSSPDIRGLARAAIAKISGTAADSESPRGTAPENAPAQPAVAPAPESIAAPAEPQIARQPARTPTYHEAAPVTIGSEAQAARPPATAPRAVLTIRRPVLAVHEGSYFRWAVPSGWTESESITGAALTAQDGLTSVSAALLLHSKGQTTPKDLTLLMLGMIPEYQSLQVVATRDLPDQPSGLGKPWTVQELEIRYAVNGAPVRSIWTTGVVLSDGTYNAFLLGYQTTPAAFESAKYTLAHIARSIAIIDRTKVAGSDKMLTPKNNALDNSALIESWREKGQSEDRIWRIQRDGTMGYERVKDPETGGVFEVPMEAWDTAAGGYHNPLKPAQIVQPLEPGE
jgi:hypothetical protein